MTTSRKYSFVLAGGSNLLIRCADVLAARGHRIEGVVSRDEGIAVKWPQYRRLRDAMQSVPTPPDILLSIVHSSILSTEEIAWATVTAVNYHDSPLPAYAGVNAPSWAILNGESMHGVTWHKMTGMVDAGDIMAQRVFPIRDADTALSLAARCFEEALLAFEEMLCRIESGDSSGTPQDVRRRSLFRRDMRLPRQGIIDWNESAAAICRWVRAGHLGPYANDFGVPKILLEEGDCIAVAHARQVSATSSEPAGTLLAIGPGHIRVATAAGEVVHLSGLTGLDGWEYDPSALRCGSRLPVPLDADVQAIEAATILATGRETRVRRLLGSLPGPLRPHGMSPFKHPEAAGSEHVFERHVGGTPSAGDVFAPMLEQLLAGHGPHPVAIAIASPVPQGFMAFRPVVCASATTGALATVIDQSFADPPIPADLPLRFPELQWAHQRIASIAVCLSMNASGHGQNPGLMAIYHSGTLTLRFAACQISGAAAASWAAALFGETAAPSERMPDDWLPVHARIQRWADAAPDSIAIAGQSGTLTYAELVRRSNALASRFRAMGVGRETVIATLLPQGADFVVAILAILKSGAAYLPLEISNPVHRLREIVRDAEPFAVVADSANDAQACLLGVQVVGLDQPDPQTCPTPDPTVAPEDLAYVIYTSGSSGEAKGSLIEHGSLAQFIEVDIVSNTIVPGDRVLQLCSVAFDASVEEIFSALCAGATLVIRPPSLLDSPHTFLDFCEEARLTIIGVFASMLADVLTAMEQRECFPGTVRLVTTGGESVNVADVQRWRQFFRQHRLNAPRFLNVYGLTETTVANCTFNLSEPGVLADIVPIGRPLPGNQVRVVDENLQSVAPGAAGELLIAGRQLARAYRGKPEVNAARFLTDPKDGARWFRTGDLVRESPGGELLYEGRIDRQIKVNGVRIELEEIERAMRAHPGVEQAAALLHRLPEGTLVLAGFFSPSSDEVLAGLKHQLEVRLPPTMKPRRLIGVAKWPINDRGKTNTAALGRLLEEPRVPVTAEADPVWQIWREFFPRYEGREEGESFFDLGGDSLLAIKLLLRVEESTGVRLPVSSFFQGPNLAGLLSMVKTGADDRSGNPLLAWQPNGGKAPLYCLHGLDGDVLEYFAMAKGIDPDRPVFAVRSAATPDGASSAGSLEAVAERVADAIANHRPGSPRILIGYSWAGILAYEVALQLFQREQVFPTVIVIDSAAPVFEFRRTDRIVHFLRQAPGWLLRTPLTGIIRSFRRAGARISGRGNAVPPELGNPFLAITKQYRARKEPRLRVHLIRASRKEAMSPLHPDIHDRWPDNGWHRATQATIHRHSFPCSHLELILEPMASILAKRVSEISDWAECTAPG